MQFGIYPSATRGDGDARSLFDEICAEASVAEQSGFSWCLLGEHHQEPGLASPLLAAGLVAMRTTKIRVGTAVLLLPLHHPAHIAEQAAMIDVVTGGGRLILGLGAGYQVKDFDSFGVSIRHRGALFNESVEVVRRCWNEPVVDFDGIHLQLKGAGIGTRPTSPEAIPLWFGANSAATLERAAAKGDAWLASRTQPMATVRAWAQTYRAAAAALGRPSRVIVIRDAWIGKNREDALCTYERGLEASLHSYKGNEAYIRQIEATLAARNAGRAPDVGDCVILGSPEDCIAQVQAWQDSGVDGLLLRFRHPGGPAHRAILDAVRLFGETVIAAADAARERNGA